MYMSEAIPQITYSPDGLLEVRRSPYQEIEYATLSTEELEQHFADHKEKVDAIKGYEIVEDGEDTVVQIDVSRVLRTHKELNFDVPTAGKLIKNIRPFLDHLGWRDDTDHVFSLNWISDMGAQGVVFPQFQKWLNAGGLDEPTAKDCIDAMAYPLGEEQRKKAKKEFNFHDFGYETASGSLLRFSAVSRRDQFGIIFYDETGDKPETKHGSADWNWLDLTTLGSCACWGVSGQDRERMHTTPDQKMLYEMNPHNVDFAVQSVSLMLGAASLAYAAANYEGEEDLFDSVTWRET